ncbi:glycosyltransferase family 4 protein [Clostridium paraputrificum]|uniref:glycosyltransferase family 4 protein n=1 Tax=Clostridium paraputrificum TaxID=29363 RepID=UPI000C07561F|nr:glycosyltransferase family 4 protein [Clostridium paraputrificum]
MKILVVSQYFWPEDFRINDICKGLKEKGHEVEILTGLPNYPKGEFFEGYSLLNKGPKEYEGMRIHRVMMSPRGKSSVGLAFNYLTFMIMGMLKSLFLLRNKYDAIFVFQVSPITSAIPALIISKIKKIPSYIYVQDLWPETFYSIINIENQKIKNVFKKICNKIYIGFDKLLIASRGYKDILMKDGFKESKFIYFPQWAEDFYSIDNKEIEVMKDINKFNVTFAGNIGKAQSVDTIIKAANLAKENKDIIWNIIGDGSEFENIKSMIKEYGLEETVVIHGRKPSSDMPKYFSISDALIVTLKNEEILKVTLPAKVQSYMAAGKPILAAISGEGNRVIEESGAGIACEAEDYECLYRNVITLKNMNKDQLKEIGALGKQFFIDNFKRNKLLNKLELILNER